MIRKITLDAIDSTLSGQYESGDILLVLCDATLAALNVVLPDVSSMRNILMFPMKIDASANAVTLTPLAGQTINGATSILLTSQYDKAILVSDTANYYRFAA